MISLTLNDLTLETILKQLQKVMASSSFKVSRIKDGRLFSRNDHLPAKVTRHHLYGKNSILWGKNKPAPLIFVELDGSHAMVFHQGDIFKWDKSTEREIFITELSPINDNGPLSFKIEKTLIPKKKQEQLKIRNKINKEFSDQYWESVRREMAEEMDRELFGDDCF